MTKEEIKVTKEKEIYSKEFVDKQLPCISFISKNISSMTEWDEIDVSVSDATGEGALKVFKSVLTELGMGNKD